MSPTHYCNDAGPCLMPPHPNLFARLPDQRLLLQQNPREDSPPLSRPTGTVLGLNDGTIFPTSHFPVVPSMSRMSRMALERAPLRGAIRVAIVLVDFNDMPMQAAAAQRLNNLFFATTDSVSSYFADVSGGRITLSGEVVGPFRMPLQMSDYAHGDHGLTILRPNIQTLAAHALAAASSGINFRLYDNDNNGYVDAFVVVHAGNGGEATGDTNDLWSAKWVLPRVNYVDNVKVYAFLTIPEDAQIGVCAHELGHLLFGWPDLYDTDSSSEGIGNWCLMSGGSWGGSPAGARPCHPSAWCKANQGWVSVVNETANRSITLADVKTVHEVHRLWTNGDEVSQEYFLVENRQRVGFDESLPGGGLLIWHIDDAKDNNDDEPYYKVGLMQADGLGQLSNLGAGRGDAGDPFPGSSNNTAFTSTSNPNSLSYAGQDTSVSCTNILLASQNMTMNITVQP